MNILIIAEKNNVAQRIAHILSDGKAGKTSHKRIPVYDFEKGGDSYTVMGLRGHIMNLDFPAEYNSWQRVSPTELINIKPIKKVQEKTYFNALKDLAKEADMVIIATDFDREGELIGVEALEIVKKFNPDFVVKRARFSSLTPEEVKKAFSNLTDIDFDLSEAAETRQVIDLVWGAVLTRFLSLAAKQMGKDFLSAGRVQSPTLALIVDREKEIRDFTPEPYFEVEAHLRSVEKAVEGRTLNEKEREFTALHAKGRFTSKEEAGVAHQRALKAKSGTVTKMERKTKKERAPAPFNTTSFLRAAASRGLFPAAAMSTAEDLYNRGIISYPRTDNTVYPSGLNLREVLEKLKETEFSPLAERLLVMKTLTPTRGKKQATDHPPIYPVSAAKRSELTSPQWKVYDLVVRRFMATLAPDAETEIMKVVVELNSEPFRAGGFRIMKKGWLDYYPYLTRKESVLPPLEKGENVEVLDVNLLSKMTKPPGHYSQGGLIQLMDSLNLGTKSTRHEIIQKLYGRGYLQNNPPEPTETAYSVIDSLESYSPVITKADMTARLEEDMNRIAEGKTGMAEVVTESREMLEKAMSLLMKNRMKVRESLLSALKDQNTVGTCPECGRPLIIRQSRYGKRFIGCSGYPKCTVTYPLPQRGKILPTGKACEVCGAPIVKMVTKGKRPREFCVNMDCPSNKREEKSVPEKEESGSIGVGKEKPEKTEQSGAAS